MDPVNILAKFEVRSFIRSWDNRGYSKICVVPVFAHAPFSPKILKGFCSHGPCEYTCQVEVRSFTRSWDNRGYSKNLGSPWIRPRSIFSQDFKGLLFGWTPWIYLPNLTFVALPIPEIIGGTPTIWGVSGFANPPYSPKFLKGFCSDGPCYIRRVHPNKSPLKIWEKRERGRIQGLPKFFD